MRFKNKAIKLVLGLVSGTLNAGPSDQIRNMISAMGNGVKHIGSTTWRALSDFEQEMMPLDIYAPRTRKEMQKKQLATPYSIDKKSFLSHRTQDQVIK